MNDSEIRMSSIETFSKKPKYEVEKTNKELMNLLKENPEIMSKLYMDILTIVQKYPPAKNENKMIYGKVAEKRIIYWLNKIIPCIELDKQLACGSEYKNDCDISFPSGAIKFSIKVSKNGGEPTLINKRNKNIHSVQNCNFIICHIIQRRLYIFTHKPDFDSYIKETGESIKYKSSIFKKKLEKDEAYFYEFPVNDVLTHFENNIIPTIKKDGIYDRIAEEIAEVNSSYYSKE